MECLDLPAGTCFGALGAGAGQGENASGQGGDHPAGGSGAHGEGPRDPGDLQRVSGFYMNPLTDRRPEGRGQEFRMNGGGDRRPEVTASPQAWEGWGC